MISTPGSRVLPDIRPIAGRFEPTFPDPGRLKPSLRAIDAHFNINLSVCLMSEYKLLYWSIRGAARHCCPPLGHTSSIVASCRTVLDADHAGAGGARSRAISDRISANSRRGTATSASWNVTYRPWLTTFAPILISVSRRLVSDHLSTVLGIASVRMKFPRL